MISKILAVTIFVLMFINIVLGKVERHIITLISGLLMLVIVMGICMQDMIAIWDTINIKAFITQSFWFGESEESFGINWATIVFIAGMTVMVEGMGHTGFFRWLCLKIAKLTKYKTIPLLIAFMLMSSILAMFIDSITVIMFLVAATLELARVLKFDPVPMILSEIFCANLGGSATMCGDPPNIIIGTSLGYSFFDFIENTGVIALICLVVIIPYFYFSCRKALVESEKNRPSDIVYPNPSDAITNKKGFILAVITFAIVVVLLVTHAQTKITVASIGVIGAVLTILSTIIAYDFKTVGTVFKKVDYKTLLFFIGLFVAVSGLQVTGILEVIAEFIAKVSGGNVIATIAIIIWVSAVASAFIDNIPFAATMIPVIVSMSGTTGIPLDTLAYTLSLGTDIGGNATPIGASANVVGTSLALKDGRPITWGKYCKYNAPATIVVVAISMVCLFIKFA